MFLSAKEGTITDQLDFRFTEASLHRQTRHLEIQLAEHFSEEMIFELESILTWAASRVEIATIFLRSQKASMPQSFIPGKLESMAPQEVQALLERVRKLVVGMFFLPQTIVMDLGGECSDLGAELSLGADLRVAHQEIQLHWNHLQLGRAPCSGGSGILALIVGDALARKWLMAGRSIGVQELLHCGFLTQAYHRTNAIRPLLESIGQQAQVARIQTKRALLQNMIVSLDQAQETEDKIAAATLISEDYRCKDSSFSSVQDFVQRLRA